MRQPHAMGSIRFTVALLALGACTAADPTSVTDAPVQISLDEAALQLSLEALASRAMPGSFGVAVLDLRSGRVTGVNVDHPFPMQSVFKAPLGAAVLAEVDAGRLTLDQSVTLARADLSPPYSPIADAWPGRTRYTVRELLELTVGGSDNTGADVLMRMIGGPAAATRYLRSTSIAGMRIDRYEREFQPEVAGMGVFREAWLGEKAFVAARDAVPVARRRAALTRYLADTRDTSTPRASAIFLSKLAAGELLSPASTAILLDIMTRTGTGANRLKAGLPAGAGIAHKTGTGRTDLGLVPAANDIGLVTLADGRRFAIASYLAGSALPEAERDALHADATRAAVASMAEGAP